MSKFFVNVVELIPQMDSRETAHALQFDVEMFLANIRHDDTRLPACKRYLNERNRKLIDDNAFEVRIHWKDATNFVNHTYDVNKNEYSQESDIERNAKR